MASPSKNISEKTKKQADKQATIIYTKVDIEDMRKQLEQNAARAQQNYKGKDVELVGHLGSIDSDGKYFALEENILSCNIMCHIAGDEQKQIIINKNRGDRIIVRGKIDDVGEIMGYSVKVAQIDPVDALAQLVEQKNDGRLGGNGYNKARKNDVQSEPVKVLAFSIGISPLKAIEPLITALVMI